MIWPFTTPDFTTFDGGDANALSSISGPMWQTPQDNSGNPILTAQVPLGFGTLPSGTVIGATSNGGEENHVLITPEMTPHTHQPLNVYLQSANNNFGTGGPLLGNASNGTVSPAAVFNDKTGGDPAATPPNSVAKGHNTLPPYYGVLFIQRSTRLFYAAT